MTLDLAISAGVLCLKTRLFEQLWKRAVRCAMLSQPALRSGGEGSADRLMMLEFAGVFSESSREKGEL